MRTFLRKCIYPLIILFLLVSCAVVTTTIVVPPIERRDIEFPYDEGKHDHARIEWWYYTGWLQDEESRSYSYELAFFKVNESLQIFRNLSAGIVYFAHFAISDEAKKERNGTEREFFPLWRQVKIEEKRLNLKYGDWGATEESPFSYHIWAKDDAMSIDLYMKSVCNPVLGMDKGMIEMGNNGVSHYCYSLPRLKTDGKLVLKGKEHSVSGISWMDHQWGNWDWYELFRWNWWGINLNNGMDLIIYNFPDPFGTTAIIKYPDGSQFTTSEVILKRLRWWESPTTSIEYPIEWSVKIPHLDMNLFIEPTFPEQEMTTRIKYWEGGCVVKGEIRKEKVEGRGYMELVGHGWSMFSIIKWGTQTVISSLFNMF